MVKRVGGKIGAVIAFALVAILVTACDDGTRGELDAKEIYGDLSALYYGAMCKSGSQELSNLRSRAVRVTVDGGKCAVLYLDGVDPKGGLLVYPGGEGARLQCKGIVDKLRRSGAHVRVLSRVQKKCIA